MDSLQYKEYLETKTVKELKAIAQSLRIQRWYLLTKKELVRSINPSETMK